MIRIFISSENLCHESKLCEYEENNSPGEYTFLQSRETTNAATRTISASAAGAKNAELINFLQYKLLIVLKISASTKHSMPR